MNPLRRSMLGLAGLLAVPAMGRHVASPARGAAYPAGPVRFIVPYPAGGLPDRVARVFGLRLAERLGQPVLVDNRPGANGVVAAQWMVHAPSDGHTFLVTDGSMFSINPVLYKNLEYDYRRDFVPVSLAARAPLYLAAHADFPARSLEEFVALVRARPGAIHYGSSGVGSTHHLSMEALKAALGLDLNHVPFKGSAQSVPALAGGQVDVLFAARPALAGFVQSGRIRLLASNAARRSAHTPGVPAIAELVPGFDFSAMVGVLAPVGTPAVAIRRVGAEMAFIAALPEVIEALNHAGIDAIGGGAAEYNRVVLGENARLAKVIHAAGLKRGDRF